MHRYGAILMGSRDQSVRQEWRIPGRLRSWIDNVAVNAQLEDRPEICDEVYGEIVVSVYGGNVLDLDKNIVDGPPAEEIERFHFDYSRRASPLAAFSLVWTRRR